MSTCGILVQLGQDSGFFSRDERRLRSSSSVYGLCGAGLRTLEGLRRKIGADGGETMKEGDRERLLRGVEEVIEELKAGLSGT